MSLPPGAPHNPIESNKQDTPLFTTPRPEPSSNPFLAWGIAGALILVLLGIVLLVTHHKPAPVANAVLPLDPYAANLVISQIVMSESTSLSGGKSTFIDGHVRNTGSRAVTGATVQVLFGNFDPAQPPQLETTPPSPSSAPTSPTWTPNPSAPHPSPQAMIASSASSSKTSAPTGTSNSRRFIPSRSPSSSARSPPRIRSVPASHAPVRACKNFPPTPTFCPPLILLSAPGKPGNLEDSAEFRFGNPLALPLATECN